LFCEGRFYEQLFQGVRHAPAKEPVGLGKRRKRKSTPASTVFAGFAAAQLWGAGEKWAAAVDLQPTTSKSDRLQGRRDFGKQENAAAVKYPWLVLIYQYPIE
jgi:hypothetical protein